MGDERSDFEREADRLDQVGDTAIGESADPPVSTAADTGVDHTGVGHRGADHGGVDLAPDTLIDHAADTKYATESSVAPRDLDRARRVGGVDLGEA